MLPGGQLFDETVQAAQLFPWKEQSILRSCYYHRVVRGAMSEVLGVTGECKVSAQNYSLWHQEASSVAAVTAAPDTAYLVVEDITVYTGLDSWAK